MRAAAVQHPPLTQPTLARTLLDSARFYHETGRWHCGLFLLMPDHVHALISFPPGKRMSQVVSDWKKYHATKHAVAWQENFFDHRLRNEAEHLEKYLYILNNPVAKNLCATPDDWPWRYQGGAGSPSTLQAPANSTSTPTSGR